MTEPSSSPKTETNVLQEDVSYQFGTRTIIGVMAGVAVGAAIVGPFVRRLDRDQVLGISAYLVSVIVLATLIVVATGWKRRRMEREAGDVRFVFFLSRWKRIGPFALLILAFLYAEIGALCIYSRGYIATAPLPTGMRPPPQLPWQFLVFQAVGGGFFLGLGLANLLARNGRVQLRERGVIVAWHFVPWKKMSRMSWSWKNQQLHFWGVATPHFKLAVPESQHATVDRFLHERIVRATVTPLIDYPSPPIPLPQGERGENCGNTPVVP